MGFADSWDRRSFPPIFDPQVHWYDSHERIMRFLETIPPERRQRVRGEDVLNDPKTMVSICRWLGIDHGPAALEAMRHPENSPFAREGPENAQWGNDPSYQSSPALRSSAPPPTSLSGPLPWRPDGQGFSTEVLSLAREFGYAD